MFVLLLPKHGSFITKKNLHVPHTVAKDKKHSVHNEIQIIKPAA